MAESDGGAETGRRVVVQNPVSRAEEWAASRDRLCRQLLPIGTGTVVLPKMRARRQQRLRLGAESDLAARNASPGTKLTRPSAASAYLVTRTIACRQSENEKEPENANVLWVLVSFAAPAQLSSPSNNGAPHSTPDASGLSSQAA